MRGLIDKLACGAAILLLLVFGLVLAWHELMGTQPPDNRLIYFFIGWLTREVGELIWARKNGRE